MKIATLVFMASLCAYSIVSLFASPAATQSWVKNYVATNTTSTAAYAQMSTNLTVSLSRATDTAVRILMDGGSNSVERACESLNLDTQALVGSIMDNTIGL